MTLRKNITILDEIFKRAAVVMKLRAIGDFSSLLDVLIREAYEGLRPLPEFSAIVAEVEAQLRAEAETKQASPSPSSAKPPRAVSQKNPVRPHAKTRPSRGRPPASGKGR